MPIFKRAYVPVKCLKCKVTYNRWSVKVHECGPRADPDEPTENRPELHHREDLKAALVKRNFRTETRPITVRGTATLGVLLPEPSGDDRHVPSAKPKRNSKRRRENVRQPKPDVRYESSRQITDMDHTKPYAHAYREQGRYGSHSSHDPFGDESKP